MTRYIINATCDDNGKLKAFADVVGYLLAERSEPAVLDLENDDEMLKYMQAHKWIAVYGYRDNAPFVMTIMEKVVLPPTPSTLIPMRFDDVRSQFTPIDAMRRLYEIPSYCWTPTFLREQCPECDMQSLYDGKSSDHRMDAWRYYYGPNAAAFNEPVESPIADTPPAQIRELTVVMDGTPYRADRAKYQPTLEEIYQVMTLRERINFMTMIRSNLDDLKIWHGSVWIGSPNNRYSTEQVIGFIEKTLKENPEIFKDLPEFNYDDPTEEHESGEGDDNLA